MMIHQPGVRGVNGCELRRVLLDLTLVGFLGGAGRIEHDQFEMSEGNHVRRRVLLAVPTSPRSCIEIVKPALPGTLAVFMIASRESPWCGGEQFCGGPEKVGIPCLPAVAGRSGAADIRHLVRAFVFAIEKIA